jgi:2-dehydro-3-deoxygalactonokinase
MNRFVPAALPDFLSGILIGAEIGGALQSARPATVSLLGEVPLCERYAKALAQAGIASSRVPDDATTRGQWRVAVQARLVKEMVA